MGIYRSPYPSDWGALKVRDFIRSATVDGKWTCAGTLFGGSQHGRHRSRTVEVRVAAEGNFLASISLSMLYP